MDTGLDNIFGYFPGISDRQKEQMAQLYPLYADWNSKINVISRKDIDNLYVHHILHSLGIAKVVKFREGTRIMDVGTGGGLPGIPLAIMFPECKFHLVDSIGKKIRVAQEIANALGLENVTLRHCRAEEEKDEFDFVVTRGVMPLVDLVKAIRKNIGREQKNSISNGILALKGGELGSEIAPMKNICTTWDLKDFFKEEFFETKKVVHVAIGKK